MFYFQDVVIYVPTACFVDSFFVTIDDYVGLYTAMESLHQPIENGQQGQWFLGCAALLFAIGVIDYGQLGASLCSPKNL